MNVLWIRVTNWQYHPPASYERQSTGPKSLSPIFLVATNPCRVLPRAGE
jgi:hypothetical protein